MAKGKRAPDRNLPRRAGYVYPAVGYAGDWARVNAEREFSSAVFCGIISTSLNYPPYDFLIKTCQNLGLPSRGPPQAVSAAESVAL